MGVGRHVVRREKSGLSTAASAFLCRIVGSLADVIIGAAQQLF